MSLSLIYIYLSGLFNLLNLLGIEIFDHILNLVKTIFFPFFRKKKFENKILFLKWIFGRLKNYKKSVSTDVTRIILIKIKRTKIYWNKWCSTRSQKLHPKCWILVLNISVILNFCYIYYYIIAQYFTHVWIPHMIINFIA